MALKRLPIFDEDKRRQMVRELGLLYRLQQAEGCPYLVTCLGAYMGPGTGMLSVVLEYMNGGSLQDLVDKVGCTMAPQSKIFSPSPPTYRCPSKSDKLERPAKLERRHYCRANLKRRFLLGRLQ